MPMTLNGSVVCSSATDSVSPFNNRQVRKNEFSIGESFSYGNEFDSSVSDALYAKNIGIARILSFFEDKSRVLDVLGGSGQIRQAYDAYLKSVNNLHIITGDIEADMVSLAVAKGIEALVVDACNMKDIANGAFDGVILAYGFHHIATDLRYAAMKEAVRVTKKGGRVILHDGVHGGCTDKLTKVTVDKYGKCPHVYNHPLRCELLSYISGLDVDKWSEFDIFDPQVFYGRSSKSAADLLHNYYIKHYGLPQKFSQTQLMDELVMVLDGHQFDQSEVGCLYSEDFWVKGKPYERTIYVGEIDSVLFERLRVFPSSRNDSYSHMAVVPRYAKIFVVEV